MSAFEAYYTQLRIRMKYYSDRKLFTGLAIAALNAS